MIETPRLILRGWREADVSSHHAMISDAEFMRHLGPPLTRADSEAAAARQTGFLASFGSCFWVVARRSDAVFMGYCGIKPGPAGTPIAGLPEIGWGIAPAFWRQGIAREAAQAALDWGWAAMDWPSVFAITVAANVPSQNVMQRIGMTRDDTADFDHPSVPDDSPLKRHILYRIDRPTA